jgi:hypothetical protein
MPNRVGLKFYVTTLLVLGGWAPSVSGQQIATRYYPEKEQYLVGEPVIVVFEVINNSPNKVAIADSACRPADSNELQDFEVDKASPRRTIELYGCGPKLEFGGCLSSPPREVPPRGAFRRRLLVEGPFELDSPGEYHVKAKNEWGVSVGKREFYIRLRMPGRGELESAYEPLFNDLYSADSRIQELAASAVAQNPPLFAEAALLKFADYVSVHAYSGVITQFAADGLRRLATPAARAKLLQMASTQWVEQPAIEALGQIGDPRDCHSMLEIASASDGYTRAEAYIAAGRICRESSIPILASLVGARDSQLLLGVAGGLVNTSSREAVPPLIAMLENPTRDVRQAAADALAALTHRKSRFGVEDGGSAKPSHGEWLAWWSGNSRTATIFGYDQCTAAQPLF